MGLFVIAVLATIIVMFATASEEKKKKEELKATAETKFETFLEEKKFQIGKEHIIPCYSNDAEMNTGFYEKFIVDDINKKFALISYNSNKDNISFNCYDYSKLINFNLFEDGEQLIAGRGLAAAGGALVFGIAGAIVGSVAGNKKIKNRCTELSIKIQVNDLQEPLLSICLLKNCAKGDGINGIYYKEAKQFADNLIATLTYIDANK